MSGFSADWLALREAPDHRCRQDFTGHAGFAPGGERTVVDLGCGSGSNYRYLQPRLGGVQHWTCIDNNAALLAVLRSHPRSAANVSNSGESDSVTTLEADLAADIATLISSVFTRDAPSGERLVTASALLDLVSARWIEALAEAAAHAGATLWMALSYDGRIELTPGHGDDAQLRSLVDAHQRTDKGFGAALGPQAHAFACATLRRCGYTVHEACSDWQLDAGDSALLGELIGGWLHAAREQAGDAGRLREWEALRLTQLRAGVLRVRVGHRDLLGLPARSA